MSLQLLFTQTLRDTCTHPVQQPLSLSLSLPVLLCFWSTSDPLRPLSSNQSIPPAWPLTQIHTHTHTQMLSPSLLSHCLISALNLTNYSEPCMPHLSLLPHTHTTHHLTSSVGHNHKFKCSYLSNISNLLSTLLLVPHKCPVNDFLLMRPTHSLHFRS